MRIFKRLLAFVVAFILVESIFTFLLEPVTFEHFLKYDERELERNHDEAELAFFGDSRAIRTFNPDIFEQELVGDVEGSINQAVNQQHIASTYYYMKDFLRENDVKCVVVNLNYEHFLCTTEEPIESKALTFDRIHSIFGMAEFVWKRFDITDYPNVLKSYRYRWQVKNIEDNLRRKTDADYWRGIDTRGDIHYVSKGYATWDLAYEQGNTGTPAGVQSWTADIVNEEALEYMDKMVQLCRENDVHIAFVESPVTIGRMYAITGYDDFEDTIKDKCQEMQVSFYNLNLLKEDNISVDDTNFTDTEHLNEVGSTKASLVLAHVLKTYIQGGDTSQYFYDTFGEMNEEMAQIGACDLSVWDTDTEQEEISWEELKEYDKSSGKFILQASSYADPSIDVLYQFSLSSDGGETYNIVREYDKNPVLEVKKADLPSSNMENIIFRVDSKPATGEDLHHCFMVRCTDE